MNKKGFTLIEIIIALALLSLISVGSVVTVKTISKILEYQNVGIVAGASTPKASIDKVINLLKNKEEF